MENKDKSKKNKKESKEKDSKEKEKEESTLEDSLEDNSTVFFEEEKNTSEIKTGTLESSLELTPIQNPIQIDYESQEERKRRTEAKNPLRDVDLSQIYSNRDVGQKDEGVYKIQDTFGGASFSIFNGRPAIAERVNQNDSPYNWTDPTRQNQKIEEFDRITLIGEPNFSLREFKEVNKDSIRLNTWESRQSKSKGRGSYS